MDSPLRVVAVALVILSTLCGIDGARQLSSQATLTLKPSVGDCMFTDSASGLISNSYIPVFGYSLVTPAAAMRCFNTIELDYGFVYFGLNALADVMNRTYVFVALAADPSGTNQTNPYGFKVFPDKVDVPGELRGLARAWPTNMSVPLGEVHFAMNTIFNRLRDAHVAYKGEGSTFGGVLTKLAGSQFKGGQRAYLVDSTTSAIVFQILIRESSDGTLVFTIVYLTSDARDFDYALVKSINGSDPMDTIVALANNPALSLPYKALGVRINTMMNAMNNLLIQNMGDLSLLRSLAVEYANGTTTTLNWGITMAPSIDAETLSNYTAKANMPGVPFMALVQALDTYVNATGQTGVTESVSQPIQGPPAATRRALQGGGARLTYIKNYGMYYFNGTRATLKLTNFMFSASDLAAWWPGFVAAAKQQGATELVLDLTNNGGGMVFSGMGLALGLYPNATVGDFGISYDRIMGPEVEYVYNNGMKPQMLYNTYNAMCSNTTWLQARVGAINNNATEFARLGGLTNAAIDAITALFSASSPDQIQACKDIRTGQTVNCDTLWIGMAEEFRKEVAVMLAAGNITSETLKGLLLDGMTILEATFWPYGGAINSTGADQYLTPVERTCGGVARNYTAQYALLRSSTNASDIFPAWTNLSATPPFNKILVVGNGYCGSTCDTFSQSAWLYSKNNPTAPKFKYASFGGTGKINDSASTSFPGGNVNDDDLLTQAWAYYAIANLQAEWSGDQALLNKVDGFADYLPIFPSFLDSYTPTYTQSEIYRAALGPNSLPTEFYLIPPDYQINAWYKATTILRFTNPATDLYDLYNEADKILATM